MQIGGLASGLDTVGLVDQLINVERRPIIQLNTRKDNWQKQMDAWRDLNTRLNSLKNKVADLKELSVFQAQKVTSSDETIISGSSSGGSINGDYKLIVNNLATATTVKSANSLSNSIDPASTLNSAGFALTPTSGTFTINGKEITIDVATDSLNTVITKINSAGAGVTATYDSSTDRLTLQSASAIQLGSGADSSNFLQATKVLAEPDGIKTTISSSSKLAGTKTTLTLENARFSTAFSTSTGSFSINGVEFTYDSTTDTLNDIAKKVNESSAKVTLTYDSLSDKMLITSKETGSLDIALKDNSGNFLEVIGLSTGNKTIGENASLSVNGTTVLSTNNSVTGIVEGLTFELKKEGEATISVQQDVDSTVGKIKAFVQQYNDVQGFINEKMAKGGILQGDSTLMRMQSTLRSNTTGLVTGISTEYKILASIGIETDKKGLLSIDEEKLKEAINNKSNSVYQLFNSENGIVSKLENEIELFIESDEGLIPEKQKSYENMIKDINDRVKVMEERLERKREMLMRQFTAMEKAMSTMMNQGTWLSGQLSQLGGWEKN